MGGTIKRVANGLFMIFLLIYSHPLSLSLSHLFSAYGLDFTYSSGDGRTVDLKPNGSDLPVTWSNRSDYVRLVFEFRLHELTRQTQAIREGLTEMIPQRFLSLLTWKELELEVCGSPEIDIDYLKANTTYNGCNSNDSHIKHFWNVLKSFTQLERTQFLRFSWGRSRLPSNATKWTDKLRIESTDADISHLPVAHTCFFSLE